MTSHGDMRISQILTESQLNPAPNGADSIRISELAERIGATPRAIRYYEELNLITPNRTQAGARTYCPETRRTLELIVTLRRAGAPLDQIRHIVAGPTNREHLHQEVSAALRARLSDLQGQIEQVKLLMARFA